MCLSKRGTIAAVAITCFVNVGRFIYSFAQPTISAVSTFVSINPCLIPFFGLHQHSTLDSSLWLDFRFLSPQPFVRQSLLLNCLRSLFNHCCDSFAYIVIFKLSFSVIILFDFSCVDGPLNATLTPTPPGIQPMPQPRMPLQPKHKPLLELSLSVIFLFDFGCVDGIYCNIDSNVPRSPTNVTTKDAAQTQT